MKYRSSLIVAALAMALSGCNLSGALGRASRVNPASVAARPMPKDPVCPKLAPVAGDAEDSINLDCFKFDPKDTDTAYRFATVTSINGGTTDNERLESQRQNRNRLGFALMGHADLLCEREKGAIYGARAATSSLLDFGSSSFSIASTIVGGEQAKSILSGLAGLSTATRTNIDSNVYQNQLTSAITKMMDTERSAITQKINSRRNEKISTFSADEMIVMVNSYHQACSFQRGIELLLDAAVNKEGVDQIVRAMNLRQLVADADRLVVGLAAGSNERAAIEKARAEAILELFEIAKSSNSVSVAPGEGQ